MISYGMLLERMFNVRVGLINTPNGGFAAKNKRRKEKGKKAESYE